MDRHRRIGRDRWPCGEHPGGVCTRREPGCQDRCPEMMEARRAHDERKRAERSARRQCVDADGVKARGIAAVTRRKIKQL